MIELPVGVAYSGGTSSKWIIHAVLRGIIPRPRHFAVFHAVTGSEHLWTDLDVLEVEQTCIDNGIPFIRCVRPRELLADHLLSIPRLQLTRAEHPPLHVLKEGGGRGILAGGRCTREFKVAPMRREQSRWLKQLGLPKRILKWVGFGADEVHRAVKANAKRDVSWEAMDFPAIRNQVTRQRQRAQLESWGVSAPDFSMCTFCPWKTPERWLATPEEQRQLVLDVDEAIRDLSRLGVTEGDCYLTNRLVPIRDIFDNPDKYLHDAQMGFEFGDAGCEGGYCFL